MRQIIDLHGTIGRAPRRARKPYRGGGRRERMRRRA
jgi:hypothetical protein